MTHQLINLTDWPTMPAPFSSTEPGEAWIWGDFVAILQIRPKAVVDAISVITGTESQGPCPFEYPFAMTVFYRKDKNPHGPSSLPILVATLEKADYAALIKKLGGQIVPKGLEGGAPVMQCLFTPEGHENFGNFDGPLTLEHARNHLLQAIGRRLSLSGEPAKIGDISAVYADWPRLYRD